MLGLSSGATSVVLNSSRLGCTVPGLAISFNGTLFFGLLGVRKVGVPLGRFAVSDLGVSIARYEGLARETRVEEVERAYVIT